VPLLLALPSAAADAAPGETRLASIVPDGSAFRLRLVQHQPTPAQTAAARFSATEQRRLHAPLTASLERHDGRLVIWPEGAWPEPIDPREPAAGPDPRGASLLFGAATVRGGDTFNSVLLASGGRLTIVADKAQPVAFTEAQLTAGQPGRVTSWQGASLAAAVCWDAVFPHLALAAARAGAVVLFYLADDSYDAGGPVGGLHLRQARLRAVESGIPVVLVQATGPSAAIAADGRIVARLPAGTPGHLDLDLPLTTRSTVPRWIGNPSGPASTLATVLLFGVRKRRTRRKGGEA
jgi:apolipoprotein N-acyltransferase